MKYLLAIFISLFLFSFGPIPKKKFRTPEESHIARIVGAWYFDNPKTVEFGVREFTRKWGERKLEDNWRRSNK